MRSVAESPVRHGIPRGNSRIMAQRPLGEPDSRLAGGTGGRPARQRRPVRRLEIPYPQSHDAMVRTVAELLRGIGSLCFARTFPASSSVPDAVARTATVTVTVCPICIDPIEQVTVLPQVQVPWSAFLQSNFTPEGRVSFTTTLPAGPGPALATVSTYRKLVPTFTPLGAEIRTERSAGPLDS